MIQTFENVLKYYQRLKFFLKGPVFCEKVGVRYVFGQYSLMGL
jgi:hypothetical protein